MKIRVYVLALLLSLAAPVMAEERENLNIKLEPKFQKYGITDPRRYTLRDYSADSKAAAPRDESRPGNLLSQPAPNRPQEYKPLNPIIISW